MRVKIKKYKKCNLTKRGRTDIVKLTVKQICKEYAESFKNKQLDIEENVNKKWTLVKEKITEAATKVLGKKVAKPKPGFNRL